LIEKIALEIKKQIFNNGIILKKWDIEFYRGFLTGFNDAFFIDETIKKQIIKDDPKSINYI